MRLAILCSGQGHQHRDMFALTADAPDAAAIFAAATSALGGRDPRALVRTDEGIIHRNLEGQVLCCTQALAAVAALKDDIGPRRIVAGYSVGELASWGCAGLLTADATLALAKTRASLMDEAGGPDQGLAHVRGLSRDAIEALCARHTAAIAIINPGAMFVIGGATRDLLALCDEAIESGATRAGLLKVAVAAHTPRLAEARLPFREALAAQTPAARPAPGIRLFSGVDGSPVLVMQEAMDKLALQICHSIDWDACLNACIEAGADTFLECGPGNALATMAAATYPNIEARALDDFRNLAGVEAWLDRHR